MDNASHNHVFGRLWEQAGMNGFDRPLERARNSQGHRAIKFKTDGMHKVLVVESSNAPGFRIRLCGFPEKPGLVDTQGAVSFAGPVETASLVHLMRQVDRWANSFEILFGAVDPSREEPGAESTQALESLRRTRPIPSSPRPLLSAGAMDDQADGGGNGNGDTDRESARFRPVGQTRQRNANAVRR